ncbi:MAG: Crp/Fnr family transcriptional regulator [Alphaproteobacteria bacterium]|nr:Crp/Fnr family transcriptional regulator [Alphaproteobacteria bacterium]
MRNAVHSTFAAKIAAHTPLSDAESAALGALVTRIQIVPAGDTVAAAGEPLDVATIVLEGIVARSKLLPDGRRQILSFLLPGDLVDAFASVLRRRDDNLEAITAAKVAVVPQTRVAAVAAEFPRLHEAFLREAFIETSIAREWVLNVGQRTADESLAHLLCELSWRMETLGLARGGVVPFPFKQQQLADALGLSTIHLNRVLRNLRGSGLIHLEARALTVLDAEALRRMAHFNPEYLHLSREAA